MNQQHPDANYPGGPSGSHPTGGQPSFGQQYDHAQQYDQPYEQAQQGSPYANDPYGQQTYGYSAYEPAAGAQTQSMPYGAPAHPGDHGGFTTGAGGQQTDAAGFFKALFDVSFTHFITPKVVKVVYLLAMVALGVMWLIVTISAFTQSAGFGLVMLLLGPVGILLYLVFIRITLEFYLATVRMSEDIHQRLR